MLMFSWCIGASLDLLPKDKSDKLQPSVILISNQDRACPFFNSLMNGHASFPNCPRAFANCVWLGIMGSKSGQGLSKAQRSYNWVILGVVRHTMGMGGWGCESGRMIRSHELAGWPQGSTQRFIRPQITSVEAESFSVVSHWNLCVLFTSLNLSSCPFLLLLWPPLANIQLPPFYEVAQQSA